MGEIGEVGGALHTYCMSLIINEMIRSYHKYSTVYMTTVYIVIYYKYSVQMDVFVPVMQI